MNLVRPRLRPILLLSALLAAAAQAQTQTAAPAEPTLESAVAERVRGLVGLNVNLPAGSSANAGSAGKARIEIEVGKLDPRLRLAPCKRIEPQLPPSGQLWGRTRIGLHCVEGERPWRVYLPVTVKVFAPALVPVRALAAGTVLMAEHLHAAEIDWAADGQAPLNRAEVLVGRTLGRAVQAGQAVRPGDLRLRQWFAAGDTVQVLARGEGFAVSGEGQALGAGLEGQTVRVRTESGRVLTGLPVAERRVEVLL